MKARALVTDIVCALLILLFVYAAVSKLADYEKFKVQLGQSPLLTEFAGFVAVAVPMVEIILSGLLIVPETKLLGLYGSFAIMVLFTTYIVTILNFSKHIPCSCGGVISTMSWQEHLVFNVVFLTISALSIILYPGPTKINTSTK